jgi:hypothetical protein
MPTGGAVRASFGLASDFEDAERLLSFIEETYRDRVPESGGLLTRRRQRDAEGRPRRPAADAGSASG